MSYINRSSNQCLQMNISYLATFLRSTKQRTFILLSTFIVFLILFYYDSSLLNSVEYNETEDAPAVTDAPSPSEVVIDMSDRMPTFKLATKSGDKPASESDQTQAKFLEELKLRETCQRDPSTIVVDVGAALGNFGLYAAACGCTVYLFEMQLDMITLIRSSMDHNSFSPPSVNVFHNAVSDLSPDSTVQYTSAGDSTAITLDGTASVQTIRLDDISWSSTSIFLLKVDVSGSELSVLRSAKKLFAEKRISHLLLKYSPWLGDQEQQKTLLTYVRRDLKPKFMYSMSRTDGNIYGPLMPVHFTSLYNGLLQSRIETNIYAVFDPKVTRSSIKSQPYKSAV